MSNISDNIYYLKSDSLFKIENGGSKRSASLDEIVGLKEKYSILIDDDYFFYIGMETVSVTGKKLRDIAANYLAIIFPDDMVKSFGVSQTKGSTVIYILSDEIIALIKDNRELFNNAKKVSSPLMELVFRYEDFTFSGGGRFYKKTGTSILPVSGGGTDYITEADLFEEISEVKNSIRLPGVSTSGFSKAPLLLPAVAFGLCYLIFVAGSVYSALSISKIGSVYEESLNKIYKTLGVDKLKDPYGALISKSKENEVADTGKRVVEILSDLSSLERSGVKFLSFSMRDKSVRINGTAEDFTQVDSLKKQGEDKLKTNITMDDTKKTEKGVSFVMKYEQ